MRVLYKVTASSSIKRKAVYLPDGRSFIVFVSMPVDTARTGTESLWKRLLRKRAVCFMLNGPGLLISQEIDRNHGNHHSGKYDGAGDDHVYDQREQDRDHRGHSVGQGGYNNYLAVPDGINQHECSD